MKPIPLTAGQMVPIGSNQFRLLSVEPLIATLQLRHQNWTWLGSLSAEQQSTLLQSGSLPETQVFLWSGQRLQPELVAALRPKVAIAASQLHPQTDAQLRQLGSQVYAMERDGALQWTPTDGFKTTLESQENSPSAL